MPVAGSRVKGEVGKMRIEEITAESIRGVSDAELRNLRFRFIQLWSKMKDPEKQREYLKRYKDLISEFDRRQLTRGRYPIDEALENYERSKGLSAGYSDLVVVPEFVAIVGSFVKTPAEAQDIDILIRQAEQDEGLERKLMKVVEDTGLAPHFVYEPAGPHSSYIPLFDLVLRSRPFEVVEVSGDEVEQAAAQVSSAIESYENQPGPSETKKIDEVNFDTLGKYPLPKPAMAGVTEARSVESIAGWCEGRTFVAEPKLNGYRVSIGKSGDKVKIISDGLENRVDSFPPEFIEYLRSVPHDFIIDSDVGIERDGKRLPRVQLARLNASQVGLDESERLVIVVFDLLWLDGEDLHLEPFEKRRQRLTVFISELKDGKNFRFELVPESPPMTSTEELERWFNKFSRLPQSEGIVVKDIAGIYPLNGVWDSVAKLKNAAEFKVIVLSVEKTKDGNYVYEVGVLPGETDFFNTVEFEGQEYINLGHTMASSIEAKPGDILTIRALEIVPLFDDDDRLVFQNASVVDVDQSRKTPYYAEQVIDIAQEYNIFQVEKAESNIDFEAGDKGRGCLQLHIMGLSEDEAKALKSAEPGVLVARLDIKKLREKLLSVIGNHGCHLDLRLARDGDDFFEGAEIFVGNVDGLSKFVSLDEGEKLRADFKIAQVDEPQVDVVRGPEEWLNIGARSIAIFEPGEVGAFSKTWAAMVRLDSFRWELYLAETHAKKFHFEDRHLSGNYLFAYVPVSANERVWMLSKLKEEDYEEETGKALEVAKARQPFGSPGGKSRSAELIISYLPEHKTYVEPFAGGAAVFWSKRPSEAEVLNDKDPDIAFCYRFIKNLTSEQKKKLRRKNWVIDEETYKRLVKLETDDPVEKFYKIIYLQRGALGIPRTSALPGHIGRHINIVADLDRYKGRLKDVVIKSTDYSNIIDEYDSKDTVFYLDPPYFNQAQRDFAHRFEEADWAGLIERLKSIKGKFILSSGSKLKNAPAVWEEKRYKVERQIRQPGQHEGRSTWEYLYANFKLVKRGQKKLEQKSYEVKLLKGSAADGDEHIVTGVVYEPEKVDAQGEYTDAEEIREACYRFMEAGAKFKLNHSGEPLDCVKLLENYIAPVSFEVNGERVKKGSWLMTLRVLAPDLWADIKSGKISGLSMAGYAYVEPAAKPGA